MGRLILVTGASAGIGEAIARRLARAGDRVLLAARTREKLDAVAASIRGAGGRAEPLALDLADPASIARAAATIAEREPDWGPLDALVHDAGVVFVHDCLDPAEDAWERTFAVHLHGPRRLDAALVPGMVARGRGRVLYVASAAGLRGFPLTAAYCASKHALLGYARVAAQELGPRGVVVTMLCPYYVDSPMIDRAVAGRAADTGESEDEARAHFRARNPGGRFVTLDQCADAAAALLASDAPGRTQILDGGAPREGPAADASP